MEQVCFEADLICCTTLVWSKHDHIGSVFYKARGIKLCAGCKELEVCSATCETICELQLILEDEAFGRVDILSYVGCIAVVSRFLCDLPKRKCISIDYCAAVNDYANGSLCL